jgi:hypothetical protein
MELASAGQPLVVSRHGKPRLRLESLDATLAPGLARPEPRGR